MPYARTSTGYPASLRALLEEVAADNLPRAIAFDSRKQAFGQRSRLYAYLAAIKRDLRDRPAWLDDAARADLTAFLQRAMTLEFVVNGADLLVRPRDESPTAAAFRNARLVDAAPVPDGQPSDGPSNTLKALLEKQHGKPPR